MNVVADIEEWVIFSSLFGYADDTNSSIQSKLIQDLIKRLELDARNILEFMASNGLVANPKKTALMILNHKSEEKVTVKVGDAIIEQEDHTKLLGMTLDEDQKWKSHVMGKGGLISSLNQKLYFIKRLKNHLPIKQIWKVAESIWSSKLRYGLQMWAQMSECQKTVRQTIWYWKPKKPKINY